MSWTALNLSVLYVVALIYGFCHEKELIQFEHNLYVAIIKALRKRLKMHTIFVKTGVTIEGLEHIEFLPVMDYKNKSIPADTVTSFDINKAIQRSLTKACARHGLGLYIYAGEDLPEGDTEQDLTEIQINSLLSLASRKGVTREKLEKKYKAKLEKLTGKQYREAVEGLNKMEDADVSGKT